MDYSYLQVVRLGEITYCFAMHNFVFWLIFDIFHIEYHAAPYVSKHVGHVICHIGKVLVKIPLYAKVKFRHLNIFEKRPNKTNKNHE